VKVLNLYVTGQYKLLTKEQLRAAEHLEDMMYELAPTMAKRFPAAFEVVGANEDGTPKYSVMEFVAYGLTDEGMQDALHAFESKRAILTTNLPDKKNAWTKFKLLIASILNVGKSYISFLPDSALVKDKDWEEYQAVNAFDKKEVEKRKKIAQINIANDDVINIFVSAHEASRQTKINRGNISATCRGLYETAGGYKWKVFKK